MGRPISERTHKKTVDKQNGHLTAETIRANKNATSKTRNAAIKQEKAAAIAARPKHAPQEQLNRLNAANLTATKERKKIAKKIALAG